MGLHLSNLFRYAGLECTDLVSTACSFFLFGICGALLVRELGVLDVEVLQVIHGNVHVVLSWLDTSLTFLTNFGRSANQCIGFREHGQIVNLSSEKVDSLLRFLVNIF